MDKAFLLSLIIFLGIVAQWIAWKLKTPAILFLLLTGIILGPVTKIINSEILFGDLLFPMITLSVAIILFEGSLTLKFSQIRGLTTVVRRLITLGALTTLIITSVVTHYVLNLSWLISILFGSITVVTGPTVIVPMLRTIKPTKTISNILKWEGIVIDPLGALLAVLVYELILALNNDSNLLSVSLLIFKHLFVGGTIGFLIAYFFGIALKKHFIPEYLKNVVALALVIFAFSISNYFQHESGLLTVTIMGIVLANTKNLDVHDLIDFKESLSVILISLLFIVLASRVNLAQIINLGPGAIIVLLAIQFISRPISIWISTFGSNVSFAERHLLSWIAPRGIVAAAISALFAIKLQSIGYQEAELLVPLTFLVIIFTVTLQSLTSRPLAKLLGVSETEESGVLIIGSNRVSLSIAEELKKNGFTPLIVDATFESIIKARMQGFETYYGEAVSPHADKHLNLVGVGKMLALSSHSALNALCILHYQVELGENSVFTLITETDKYVSFDRSHLSTHLDQVLFSKDLPYSEIERKLYLGWEISSTKLSKEYSLEMYIEQFQNNVIPLFAISAKGALHPFTEKNKPSLKDSYVLISLIKK